ncbi:DUF2000 domain-containing protein [Liquorilactobacillus satsumensis]|uniref:DUF2000 domain-containing protein n=1 Tax=Liquorilactobacillus satsumensis TaxID=259059 RepID=UPI0007049771|nr:DUF2000 domain-containing protein [Liquorilactobacillus satsumensis]
MQTKCVLVINSDLPIGLSANTAAILGCSLGTLHPEINGKQLTDAENGIYPGIVQIPLPVLEASSSRISEMQKEVLNLEQIEVLSFVDCAQQAKNYLEYATQLRQSKHEQLQFLGICLYGQAKLVNHFTGDLPILK